MITRTTFYTSHRGRDPLALHKKPSHRSRLLGLAVWALIPLFPSHSSASGILYEVKPLPTGLMTLSCLSPADPSGAGQGCERALLRYASHDSELNAPRERPQQVLAHCGFDGWNKRDSLRSFSEDESSGNRNAFFEILLSAEAGNQTEHEGKPAQIFSAEFPLVGDEKALHCAFATPSRDRWDNNAGKDFAWGFRFPYSGPWLTVGNTAQGSTFESIQFENDLPARACLRYWPSASPQETQELCSDVPQRIHRFRLENLTPNSNYSYVISSDALDLGTLGQVNSRRSRTYEFVSLPKEEPASGWNLLVFSDLQDNGDGINSRFLFDALAAAPGEGSSPGVTAQNAHLAIIPGDLAYNDEPGLWWTLFDNMSPVSPFLRLLPAIGNHDTPGNGSSPMNGSFRSYFDLGFPDPSGAYFAFEHDNLAVYSLDSERPKEFQPPAGPQYVWMQERLAERARATDRAARRSGNTRNTRNWTFSQWHIPCVNAGQRHSNRSPEFDAVTKLLGGVVDWHISGHEHAYQRSLPLIHEEPGMRPRAVPRYGLGPNEGTGFLVLPPGGTFPGTQLRSESENFYRSLLAFPPPGAALQANGGFLTLRLQGPRFELKSFGIGSPGARIAPTLVDEVTYSKP